jgi:hypothetical protein
MLASVKMPADARVTFERLPSSDGADFGNRPNEPFCKTVNAQKLESTKAYLR